jgi:glyoxylase-like metal-dependent hydrolase (beta-lactamase superfamily II)
VSPVLHAQGAGVLKNLEIGFYRADTGMTRVALDDSGLMRMALDQPLSDSRFEYSATVEQRYGDKLFIRATAPDNSDSELKIDGVAVRSGELHAVDLKMGINRYVITVTSPDATPARYHLAVIRRDLSRDYKVTSLGKGIWRIEDVGGAPGFGSCYLVEGTDRALLIDTAVGKGDLMGLVQTLTPLPVDVAITNGRGDGQVDQFKDSTVYASKWVVGYLPFAFITPKFKWVKDGDVIDLGGGHKFEVIEMPGHTLSSEAYLDRFDKIAAVGDSLGSGAGVWIWESDSTALDQYADSVKRLESRVTDVDDLTLLVSHHYQEKIPMTGADAKQLIADMHAATEKVLAGELQGKPFTIKSHDGSAQEIRKLYFGLAGLTYDPGNIRTAPAALGTLDLMTSTGKVANWTPAFSSMHTSYKVELPDQSTSIDVTPTAYWRNYKAISMNGAAVKSGATHSVGLVSGANKIEITVTGTDDSKRTYTLLIQR